VACDSVVVRVQVPKRGRLHVTRAFGCLSTRTAVMIFGLADMMVGFMAVAVAAMVLYVRTHEHEVDKAVVEFWAHASNSTQAPEFMSGFSSNMTVHQTSMAVRGLNQHIDFFAARSIPMLIFLAVVYVCYGYLGCKAGDDARCAQRFYVWKLVQAVFAVFSCSMTKLVLSWYAVIVIRSHTVALLEKLAEAHQLPTVVQVHFPAAAAPAPAPGKVVEDDVEAAAEDAKFADVKLV